MESPNDKYLNEDTLKILSKTRKERLDWVRQDHFILYNKAEKILNYLEWIISQPRRINADLDSLSIIGETGTGKTTIVNKFKSDHNHGLNFDDRENHKVVHCILPDSDMGLKGLFISILHADPFYYPIPEDRLRKYTVIQLEKACINLLKNTEVRILFVDEIQHALGRKFETTLNSLKRLVLLSGVPLVPVGTFKAKNIFTLDDQLADRCPTKSFSILSEWEYNDEFRRFLSGYEKYIPLSQPSNLGSKEFSLKIFKMCTTPYRKGYATNIRRVSRLIKGVSAIAIKDRDENITLKHLRIYGQNFL